MALFATLISDGSSMTPWPNSYGDAASVGGRIQVPCTNGFAAAQSDVTYTLDGSYIQGMLWPADGSDTTSATTEMLVLSGVGGTDAGFSLQSAGTPTLNCISRVGYGDGSAVAVTYNSTTMRWLRLAHDGTDLIWSTSPDGVAWTSQRTQAAPAWTDAVDTLQLALACHKDSGATSVGEFDNVNVMPNVGTAAASLPPATSAATATQTLTGAASVTLPALTAAMAGRVITGAVAVTSGPPEARWSAGSPGIRWDAGLPATRWSAGTPTGG